MLTGMFIGRPLQVWLDDYDSSLVVSSHSGDGTEHVMPGCGPAIMPNEGTYLSANAIGHPLVKELPVERTKVLDSLSSHNLEL